MSKTDEILARCNKPGAETGPTSAELREILHESHVEGAPTVHVLTPANDCSDSYIVKDKN